MKILLSWSSGKDSAWALHLLNQQYPGCVAALLTTVNEAYDRVAMHGVRADVLHAQARAARLPLRIVFIPDPCSNEAYEKRMGSAVTDALADGFTHVAVGDHIARRHQVGRRTADDFTVGDADLEQVAFFPALADRQLDAFVDGAFQEAGAEGHAVALGRGAALSSAPDRFQVAPNRDCCGESSCQRDGLSDWAISVIGD